MLDNMSHTHPLMTLPIDKEYLTPFFQKALTAESRTTSAPWILKNGKEYLLAYMEECPTKTTTIMDVSKAIAIMADKQGLIVWGHTASTAGSIAAATFEILHGPVSKPIDYFKSLDPNPFNL